MKNDEDDDPGKDIPNGTIGQLLFRSFLSGVMGHISGKITSYGIKKGKHVLKVHVKPRVDAFAATHITPRFSAIKNRLSRKA